MTTMTADNAQIGVSKTSLAVGAIFLAISAYFLMWAFDYTNGNNLLILTLATLFGLFMAFNIGGNDVANSFGTSVGAGTLSVKQALLVAAVFEVSGAVIAGGEVTKTIRKGIVDLSSLGSIDPMLFVFVMMSALLSAALWLLFATKRGWPVSTTHSIVGGIVGASITLGFYAITGGNGFDLVQWSKIGMIAVSWVLSPVLGGVFAYILYKAIKETVFKYNDEAGDRLNEIKKEKKALRKEYKQSLETMDEASLIKENARLSRDAQLKIDGDYDSDELESDYYKKMELIEDKVHGIDAHKALRNYVPLIAALGAIVISSMVLFKGLKHVDISFSTLDNLLIMLMIGSVTWLTVYIFSRTLAGKSLERSTFLLFSWMQVFTACGFAFSHGSNDIANAIGPFAAVLDVLHTGEISAKAAVPPIAMLAFGIAMVAGLWFIGKEVIQTVGHNLTKLHPASGFSAELAAAGVVLVASTFGIPVSSTHILIGAVLGVGIVNADANWSLLKPIFAAWVITLPAAGIMASIVFIILSSVF
ncbi:inorganic phosphate transporter [Thiomicrorhabdus sp.]|uniref:inorganic phosphate transporter n=1 Tax=Thiomicrorhabdus sp. TaxID=2039724 RepID=UPI0029C67373|nr:inorganic phosphate transporter [Thiomicrorhabdus sp.]